MKDLIYISFPYPYNFTEAPQVFDRASMTLKWMKEMEREGFVSVCPHINFHILGNSPEEVGTWIDRRDQALKLIESVNVVQVLMFKGWEQSICVKDEVHHARACGKPVTYINTQELEDWLEAFNSDRSHYLRGLGVPVSSLENAESDGSGNGELRDAESVESGHGDGRSDD